MLTSIQYILLCALRDRLFVGLLAGVAAATLISAMLGGTAFLEEREMSLAYAGAAARIILVIGLVVFACFHVRQAFDSREIDVMLSRPLSRPQLVVAYWLGFSAVATLLAVPTAGVLLLIGPMSDPGFLSWSVSLLLETWFVVALALFASLALKSAVGAVMASLGFYVLSRMIAFFVMTADSITKQDILLVVTKYLLSLVSVIMPRLDFFSKTEWLIYGTNSSLEWRLFLAQAAIFIPLLLLAAIIDFKRKQF
jgi:ABC-type transport system involved in multi-copper enzyme maturation permease subunit